MDDATAFTPDRSLFTGTNMDADSLRGGAAMIVRLTMRSADGSLKLTRRFDSESMQEEEMQVDEAPSAPPRPKRLRHSQPQGLPMTPRPAAATAAAGSPYARAPCPPAPSPSASSVSAQQSSSLLPRSASSGKSKAKHGQPAAGQGPFDGLNLRLVLLNGSAHRLAAAAAASSAAVAAPISSLGSLADQDAEVCLVWHARRSATDAAVRERGGG